MGKGLLDINHLLESLFGFLDTKIKLVQLDAKERIAIIIGKMVLMLFLLFSGFLALSFISIAICIHLNVYLNSEYLGFFIIGGCFLALIFVFIFVIKKINLEAKIADKMDKMLNKKKNEAKVDI